MKTQDAVLSFLREHIRKNCYAPSTREIALAVGLKSQSTVAMHLERLEQKGIIRRSPKIPRAIEVVGDEARLVPAEEIRKIITHLEVRQTLCLQQDQLEAVGELEVALYQLKGLIGECDKPNEP